MKHIHVDLGKDSYDIHIENGLLDRAGDYIRNLTKSQNLAVISDSNVDALYGQRLETVLTKAGFRVHRLVFPAGEEHKCAATLLDLYQQLSDAGDCQRCLTFGGVQRPRRLRGSDLIARRSLYPDSDDDYFPSRQQRWRKSCHRPAQRQESGRQFLPAQRRPHRWLLSTAGKHPRRWKSSNTAASATWPSLNSWKSSMTSLFSSIGKKSSNAVARARPISLNTMSLIWANV